MATTRANIIVGLACAFAVLLACAVFALPGLMGDASDGDNASDGGDRVLVHDGDGNVHELSLSEDSTTTVETSLGTNVVEVKDGAVYVSAADCDNHDCMRQGKIGAPGKQIICLPHKLWIEIVSAGDEGGQMDESAVNGSSSADANGSAETSGSSSADESAAASGSAATSESMATSGSSAAGETSSTDASEAGGSSETDDFDVVAR